MSSPADGEASGGDRMRSESCLGGWWEVMRCVAGKQSGHYHGQIVVSHRLSQSSQPGVARPPNDVAFKQTMCDLLDSCSSHLPC